MQFKSVFNDGMRGRVGAKDKGGTKRNSAWNFIRLSLDCKKDAGYWINNDRSKEKG